MTSTEESNGGPMLLVPNTSTTSAIFASVFRWSLLRCFLFLFPSSSKSAINRTVSLYLSFAMCVCRLLSCLLLMVVFLFCLVYTDVGVQARAFVIKRLSPFCVLCVLCILS